MSGGRAWTTDESELLRQRIEEGMTLPELARLHGRTPAGVSSRAYAMSLQLGRRMQANTNPGTRTLNKTRRPAPPPRDEVADVQLASAAILELRQMFDLLADEVQIALTMQGNLRASLDATDAKLMRLQEQVDAIPMVAPSPLEQLQARMRAVHP